MNISKEIDRLLRDFLLFVFDLLRFIPISIVDLFPKLMREEKGVKEIFLIKSDEIGDYILFRNFLPFIKSNEVYKNYKIVLCGNIAWKNLAGNLDAGFVDEFIWIDKNKLLTNLIYRFKLLKNIAERNPLVSINCSYSRSYYIDDALIRVINSERKVGFKTDLSNSYKWQVKCSDNYYTDLVSCEGTVFDFYKNKIFFEKLFKVNIPIIKPLINKDLNKSNYNIVGQYAVLFVGGKYNYKRWNLKNFVKLGECLIQKYMFKIILCGAYSEQKLNGEFFINIKNKDMVLDITGKTSLIDLIKILGNARLLVSNDTGIVHLAASMDVPTLVLANGTQFGRFLPYPLNIKNTVKAIYPPQIYNILTNKDDIQKKLKYRSLFDINDIDYEIIAGEIDKIISTV